VVHEPSHAVDGGPRLALADVARATGGVLAGPDVEVDGVGTDSRTLAAGALYVALRGERFDGHRFIEAAAARGARAALVSEAGAAAHGLPLVRVADTRASLGALGAWWRNRFAVPLVALTGSSGKTTVKEMLACVLRAHAGDAAVLATQGNLNNDIGVPLTLLRLRDTHRYAIVEMGMNHEGEIRHLTGLARPGVALVINAGRAHLGELGSVEAIARAKGEIFEGLDADGIAVLNADDVFLSYWTGLNGGRRIVDFGLDRPAAVSGRYRRHDFGSEIVLKAPPGEVTVTLRVGGEHNVRNALAATAVAIALDVPLAAVAAGLNAFRGVRGRLERKQAIAGATLIDDTYNANPESVQAALDVLAGMPGRRVLVLGDMGELGAAAAALHAGIGTHARAAGIDRLLAVGEHAGRAVESFGSGGRHYPRIEELLADLEGTLAPDVTVVVKGSRFMQMERVVQRIEQAGEA
jgi:UDP-N-acetylmuramoyl-tripeptide--D-alanyl-D-alanine ligase